MLLKNIHDKVSSTVKQIYKFKIIWTEWKFNYSQSQISWTWGNSFLFLFTAGVIFPRESFFFIFYMKKNNPIVFFLQKKSNLSTARGGGVIFLCPKVTLGRYSTGVLIFPLIPTSLFSRKYKAKLHPETISSPSSCYSLFYL